MTEDGVSMVRHVMGGRRKALEPILDAVAPDRAATGV
jgi:hypothetical protein